MRQWLPWGLFRGSTLNNNKTMVPMEMFIWLPPNNNDNKTTVAMERLPSRRHRRILLKVAMEMFR